MSIEITETIIKRVQVQLPAETMEALITKAALEAAGLKPAEGVIVKAHGFATKVEITQELDAVPLPMPAVSIETKAPEPASVKAAAPQRGAPTPIPLKRNSPATVAVLPASWTPQEDALIVSTAAAMGDVARSKVSGALADKLPHRTPAAIEFRMRNKLNSQIIAAKISTPIETTDAPETVITAAAAIAPSSRSAGRISPDLAAHIKALPKVEGWALADDAELMDRVTKNQNTAVIAAGMEREAAFVIQRVDRLLGRKKGGAVTYGRQAVATALAELAAIAKEAVQ